MDLFSPVTALKGVGAVRAKQLAKLHIETLYDLIAFFPRDYEDRTKLLSIAGLTPGEPACFEAMVISQPQLSRIRKGMELVKVRVADETGRVDLVFFNQPYVKDQLNYGESYRFYGAIHEGYGHQMQNPAFEPVDAAGVVTGRILPIYPLTAGITNKLIGACVRQALDACLDSLPDILPEAVQARYGLCSAHFAYETVHLPASFEALQKARRRLVFEEFFIFSAGLAAIRTQRDELHTKPMDTRHMEPFYSLLPFTLTRAQQAAIDDILRDLASCRPMNRLVQGDVGSGKTMVAAAACFCAIQNGHQAAFMAPTEILAEQHAGSLQKLFSPLGISVVLMTGSLTATQKRQRKAEIADGSAQLIVGTHALITQDVAFHDLALVVCDEQHRFGVAQRAALSAKGQTPHLLVMSATPIPRTLALIAYGDLDVSVIGELPPGRLPVDTFLIGEDKRQRLNAFIEKQCEASHQVYIVCPTVEESDLESLKSAESFAQTLRQVVFPHRRVGLLHGKMKQADKDAALGAFSRGETDILVATTVVEVGVDVPNATLMVIENADRFGLSQLHQLRGRVGRGSAQSYCVLVSGNRNEQTRKRLKALCATTDGFKIAEEDLALRGPGDFLGSRQHGLPLFKVADLQLDMQTLMEAKQAAGEEIRDAETLERPEYDALRARVHALFRQSDLALN